MGVLHIILGVAWLIGGCGAATSIRRDESRDEFRVGSGACLEEVVRGLDNLLGVCEAWQAIRECSQSRLPGRPKSQPEHKTRRHTALAPVKHGLRFLGLFATAPSLAASKRGCLIAASGSTAGSRQSQIAMRAAGLLYATMTSNTEEVASVISKATGLEVTAADDLEAGDLVSYDGLIVGCPTWNTGADEYRSGTAWDDLLEDIKGLSLSGKPVAVFGCGDSQAYGDNFCDGIEEE